MLGCLLLLCRPLPAWGASRTENALPEPNYAHAAGMHGLLHWPRMPVRVYFTPGAATTSERRAQVRAGFDEWVQATGGVISYQVVDTPARANITVTLDSGSCLGGDPDETGNTDMAFSGRTLKRAAMEIAAGGTTPNQLQGVAAHEFGHALGIDGHSDDPNDLMTPTQWRVYQPDGTPVEMPAQAVTLRDLNTLKSCYGALLFPPSPPRTTTPGRS